ncbi:MAG: protein-L-isoaspartate(D-aspartate) O-methyltransferase [Endomicrobiia bacterium]
MLEEDKKLLRIKMIETQLIPRGINDKRVLNAMKKIPRDMFVPEEYIENAYDDHPLPIGEGQTISQPYIVALMTQVLELTGKEKTLEIGTGSGYQTAILAELSYQVYTIERIKSLLEKAEETLKLLKYENILFKLGDGTEGWKEFSPYDRIIVTAASDSIPQPLIEQLSQNKGRMVIPVGGKYSQVLTLIIKNENKIEKKEICECVFVPLIGKYGYKEK